MRHYRVASQPVGATTRAAIAARAARSMTRGRLYSCHAVFERLAQDIEDMARARGQLIEKEEQDIMDTTPAGHSPWPPLQHSQGAMSLRRQTLGMLLTPSVVLVYNLV